MSRDRLYTEREISAILKRSGELQAKQGKGAVAGLSLDELQDVAAEAGLDPALVAEAAAELEGTASSEQSASWPGIPTVVTEQRVIVGTVAPADWAEVKRAIDRSLGVVGSMSQERTRAEWTHSGLGGGVRVTVVSSEGHTRVRYAADHTRLVSACLFSLFALGLAQGFLFPFGGDLPALGSAGIGILLGGVLYLATLFGLRVHARARVRDVQDVVESLSKIARTPEPVLEAAVPDVSTSRIFTPDDEPSEANVRPREDTRVRG